MMITSISIVLVVAIILKTLPGQNMVLGVKAPDTIDNVAGGITVGGAV